MPVVPFSPVAFRCKTCGRLHEAGHAGDERLPHACRVCDSGVTHNPTIKRLAAQLGQHDLEPSRRHALVKELSSIKHDHKSIHPDNWEVLADATDERLAELGLTRDQVCRHVSISDTINARPKVVIATVQDGPLSQDQSDQRT